VTQEEIRFCEFFVDARKMIQGSCSHLKPRLPSLALRLTS